MDCRVTADNFILGLFLDLLHKVGHQIRTIGQLVDLTKLEYCKAKNSTFPFELLAYAFEACAPFRTPFPVCNISIADGNVEKMHRKGISSSLCAPSDGSDIPNGRSMDC